MFRVFFVMVLVALFAGSTGATNLCEVAQAVIEGKLQESVRIDSCRYYSNRDGVDDGCFIEKVISSSSGVFNLRVRCDRNRSFWLVVSYSVKRPVAIAKTFITKGNTIDDKYIVKEDWVNGKDLYKVAVPDSLRDAVARRNIDKGSIIYSNDLYIPYMVRRNELVKVIYRDGGVVIEMTAVAKDNGRLGDTIKVQNPVSGTIFAGRVVGSKVVEAM